MLFVGNSLTHYNKMPDFFKIIAESAGYQVDLNSITKGGHHLLLHADVNDATGRKVDEFLKQNTNLDYVVIQDGGSVPVLNPDNFRNGVRNMQKKIDKTKAKTIIYETWGYKKGFSTLEKLGMTSAQFEEKLRSECDYMAKEIGATVSYVGKAFIDVYTNNPQIELYNPDKLHPSLEGSYLAALTHYGTIFRSSPKDITFKLPKLTTAQDKILKTAAHKAVFG